MLPPRSLLYECNVVFSPRAALAAGIAGTLSRVDIVPRYLVSSPPSLNGRGRGVVDILVKSVFSSHSMLVLGKGMLRYITRSVVTSCGESRQPIHTPICKLRLAFVEVTVTFPGLGCSSLIHTSPDTAPRSRQECRDTGVRLVTSVPCPAPSPWP